MFYEKSPKADKGPRGWYRRLGLRRTLTLAFLLALVFGTLTVRDSSSEFGQHAQAGNCFTMSKKWSMQSGDVPVNYGDVHFGATICLDNGGQIDSVSPFLNGGVSGAGTPAGFNWDNRGAWVHRQTADFVEVRGQAKSKLCLVKYVPVCSLTDTQTFSLRYHTTWGPHVAGQQAGVFASSKVCTVGGGCMVGTRFK